MNTPQRARTGASISKVAQSTIFTVFALAALVLSLIHILTLPTKA